ncbi:HlyD family type I secretion periplasmic adaptor subunit [Falsiroseomonas tokyonensis]|uniref:Membrane fusion protein (MFP) family protein n=1 Tax=Falsiroseomonas tokyonensis TaxID=430521 RepID=A0ABV7BTH0_9PROT|nr:HlyD family type I secretion periplasmic adaptor subunit [Falsiroseomonas tokyonensis]MBU8537951.1 HlyD family type I secretion periplasmic adaptor subunit [Falsiroseomonas tokyonensis]
MSGAIPMGPNSGPQPIGSILPVPAITGLAPRPAAPPPALWQPPEPDSILDAQRPRTAVAMWLGYLIVGIFVIGLGVWASLVPLAEAAIAPGVLKVEGTRRTIQHFEGGIVREILVRDGDVVTAGQVLMRLDQPQAAQQTETLRSQRWALLAQDARLEAELARAPSITFPPDLLASREPRAEEVITGQRALFQARSLALESQVQVLRARIDQHRATIASAEGQMDAQRRMLVLLRAEESNTAQLLRQGLARLPQLLALQRQVASVEGNVTDIANQMVRSRAQIEEAEREIERIETGRTQEASTELREVRLRLSETEERLRAAENVSTRLEIVAPENGTVLNLRVFTVGAVVRAGDPVMDLVPAEDRLVAEVHVQPNDIDVIHDGLQAEIRLPAFKQRLVPYLHGHVTFVASDVTEDERRGLSYYRVQILLDESQIQAVEGLTLRAGMAVEAQIRTGERTFARYMMQPLIDSFHRAFREQ